MDVNPAADNPPASNITIDSVLPIEEMPKNIFKVGPENNRISVMDSELLALEDH